MLILKVLLLFLFYSANCDANVINSPRSIVCYWNSSLSTGNILSNDNIRTAAGLCTHLVYGFADIDASNFKAVLSNSRGLDDWKEEFPQLRIYLSVGGSVKADDLPKYLTVLESSETRTIFINSVTDLLKNNNFDGIDLAWPFPAKVPEKNSNIFKKAWKGIKNLFGKSKFVDNKVEKHREQFRNLVRELKTSLKAMNKNLTLTILPNSNVTAYYDITQLVSSLNAVHLMDFDQRTAERYPKVADYPAPIYDDADESIDASVRKWENAGTAKSQIIVGIPTYARTWKLTRDSETSGVPPLLADGPGKAGSQSQTPGILSYSEVCAFLKEPSVEKFTGSNVKSGNYAFKLPNEKNPEGIWVGYEDTTFAINKCKYVKSKNLGGMAISDLSTDDLNGSCDADGEKFSILRTIKSNL